MVVGAIILGYVTVRALKKKGTGALTFIAPLIGKVTSAFGYRTHPVNGQADFHNGIDISAPIGTQVKAPASGTVYNTYYNSAGGNQLLVNHAGGYQTGYAHLSKILVKPGQAVTKGQVIAESGNTGNTTGPHLHFTMRLNGKEFNPLAKVQL